MSREWARGLTNSGAKIFGGEDLDGEVGVDLADDLCGVAVCEVGFLLDVRNAYGRRSAIPEK